VIGLFVGAASGSVSPRSRVLAGGLDDGGGRLALGRFGCPVSGCLCGATSIDRLIGQHGTAGGSRDLPRDLNSAVLTRQEVFVP
jgi:hypothetical protein